MQDESGEAVSVTSLMLSASQYTQPKGLKCCFECAGLTVAAYLGTLAACAFEHRKDDPDKKGDIIEKCADSYGGLAQLAVLATCVKTNPACHPHGSLSNYAGFSTFPSHVALDSKHLFGHEGLGDEAAHELARFAHAHQLSASKAGLPAPFINFEKPKHKRMELDKSPSVLSVHKAAITLVPHDTSEVEEAFQLLAYEGKSAAMKAGKLAHRQSKRISKDLGDAGTACVVECGAIAAGFFFATSETCAKLFPDEADTACVNWTYGLTAGPVLGGCLAALPVCRKHADSTASSASMVVEAGAEVLSWASRHFAGAKDAIIEKLQL